jgi:hypothetical protein
MGSPFLASSSENPSNLPTLARWVLTLSKICRKYGRRHACDVLMLFICCLAKNNKFGTCEITMFTYHANQIFQGLLDLRSSKYFKNIKIKILI